MRVESIQPENDCSFNPAVPEDLPTLKVQYDCAKRECNNGEKCQNNSDKKDKERRHDGKSCSRAYIGKGIRLKQQKKYRDG